MTRVLTDNVPQIWLRMYDEETGLPSPRLLKAAPEKDCDDSGGVTFSQWSKLNDTYLPLHREFVRGLDERTMLVVSNQSCQWLDEVPSDLFDSTLSREFDGADAPATESSEDSK